MLPHCTSGIERVSLGKEGIIFQEEHQCVNFSRPVSV